METALAVCTLSSKRYLNKQQTGKIFTFIIPLSFRQVAAKFLFPSLQCDKLHETFVAKRWEVDQVGGSVVLVENTMKLVIAFLLCWVNSYNLMQIIIYTCQP